MGWTNPSKIERTRIPDHIQPLQRIKFNTYRRYRPEYATPQPFLDLCNSVVKDEPFPKCWNWTPDEVAEFIKQLGFPEYQDAFKINRIDGKSLLLVEADKMPKLNITNMESIQKITRAIRELYKVDQESHKRYIKYSIGHPKTLYLWYKGTRTGPKSSILSLPEFYKKLKVIRDESTEDRRYYSLLNHWNRIPPYREWCPHVLIGNIRRINPMTGTTTRQISNHKILINS